MLIMKSLNSFPYNQHTLRLSRTLRSSDFETVPLESVSYLSNSERILITSEESDDTEGDKDGADFVLLNQPIFNENFASSCPGRWPGEGE